MLTPRELIGAIKYGNAVEDPDGTVRQGIDDKDLQTVIMLGVTIN